MPEKSTNVFDLLLSLLASEKFIAAFLGLVAGTIATFAAPWTKWKFEREKIKLDDRKAKIKQWRSEIDQSKTYYEFQQTATFHYFKDKFTAEELHNFNITPLNININLGYVAPNLDKQKLGRFHEEVSKIEKEWKIV